MFDYQVLLKPKSDFFPFLLHVASNLPVILAYHTFRSPLPLFLSSFTALALVHIFIVVGFLFIYFCFLETEGKRERENNRETNIAVLLHLFMHSLVASCIAPTEDGTCNLGV